MVPSFKPGIWRESIVGVGVGAVGGAGGGDTASVAATAAASAAALGAQDLQSSSREGVGVRGDEARCRVVPGGHFVGGGFCWWCDGSRSMCITDQL
jgi:hypothetical protein